MILSIHHFLINVDVMVILYAYDCIAQYTLFWKQLMFLVLIKFDQLDRTIVSDILLQSLMVTIQTKLIDRKKCGSTVLSFV